MAGIQPLRRIGARIAAGEFLRQAQSMQGLSAQHQTALTALGENIHHFTNAIVDQGASPKAQQLQAAIDGVDAAPSPSPTPGPHPILQAIFGWLGGSGFTWLWSIATALLNEFFHIPLPPIPSPPA